VLRHKPDVAVFDRLDGRLRQRLRIHEPLIGQSRLYHDAGPVAIRHRHRIFLDLFKQTEPFHLLDHLAARLLAAKSAEMFGHLVVQIGIDVENTDHRQVVPLADLEIVEVVRRRNLDCAGPLFRV